MSEYSVGPSTRDTTSGAEAGLCSAFACISTDFGNRASTIAFVDSFGFVVNSPFGRLTKPSWTHCFLKAPLQN